MPNTITQNYKELTARKVKNNIENNLKSCAAVFATGALAVCNLRILNKDVFDAVKEEATKLAGGKGKLATYGVLIVGGTAILSSALVSIKTLIGTKIKNNSLKQMASKMTGQQKEDLYFNVKEKAQTEAKQGINDKMLELEAAGIMPLTK